MIRQGTWLAAASLLWAANTSASPVPSGAMADYHLECNWAGTLSQAGCAALVDRLAALEWPSRDERLALLVSRDALADWRGESLARAEVCAGLRAIVADHPDYAVALYQLAHNCTREGDGVTLLRRALEIEPDNHDALSILLFRARRSPHDERIAEIGSQTLAAYREALYESAKERDAWEFAAAAAASKNVDPRIAWGNLFNAAVDFVRAALREGDLDAAEAMRARVRRDAGLDELDYSVAANVVLACQPIRILEEVCVTAIERLAGLASAEGLPLPDAVLAVVESATESLRSFACAESTGQAPYGLLLQFDECLGPGNVTETAAVARLRAVLEHHGGPWSSEHHRVHAQGFLGDAARRDGLRAALRTDPDNARAQCYFARVLADAGAPDAAAVLGEGSDPSCLEFRQHVWGDSPEVYSSPKMSLHGGFGEAGRR